MRKAMVLRNGLLLAGFLSGAIVPPIQATPTPSATECYHQALSFGASELDRDRADYLCEGAIDRSPAQCYWNALSFGADTRIKNRAARLCRNATSTEPAQCYWDFVGYGATRSTQRRTVRFCKTPDRFNNILILIPNRPTH
jgi:hypothetical protein